MGGSDTLWQLQGSLRKSGLALPGGLLFVASGVVLYQHIAPHSDYPMRIWLTLILATMLPLAYIDMVIPGCGDPLGLLRKYGAKTLLMHMVFLVLRLRLLLHTERDTMLLNAINVGGLVSVTLALHFGYNILSCLSDHYDVLYYVGAAVVVAIITEVVGAIVGQAFEVDNLRSGVIPAQVEQFIMATGNFVEVLSFAPAVWVIFVAQKKEEAPADVGSGEAKRNAIAFSLFLLGFYFLEDVVTAFILLQELPLRALSHLVHWLMLADLCVFLLAYAFNPDKGARTLLVRFTESCGV